MTRRNNSEEELNPKALVDKQLSYSVGFGNRPSSPALSRTGEEPVDIPDDAWEEFVYLCKYIYRFNPEATLYDAFEWIRTNVNGGNEYSPSLIDRVDQEIENELRRLNDGVQQGVPETILY